MIICRYSVLSRLLGSLLQGPLHGKLISLTLLAHLQVPPQALGDGHLQVCALNAALQCILPGIPARVVCLQGRQGTSSLTHQLRRPQASFQSRMSARLDTAKTTTLRLGFRCIKYLSVPVLYTGQGLLLPAVP